MAGKRPHKESVIGYVHNLSPLKRNRNNTMNYATLTLQTSSNETKEALLYSPQKRQLFAERSETRTPVKLVDIAYTDDQKIIVNDMTCITTPSQSEYDFQFVEVNHATAQHASIIHILNNHKEWHKVAVKAKVTQLKDVAVVGKKGLRLCEALLSDTTGTIPFDIWENNIVKFQLNSVYCINPLVVRVWDNRKKLSTLPETTVQLLTDVEELENLDMDEEVSEKTKVATIKEIESIQHFEKYLKCYKCHRKIQQTSTSKIVKCDRCGTLKKDKAKYGITLKLETIVDKHHEPLCVRFGDEVLSTLLEKDVIEMKQEELEEQVIFLESVEIEYEDSTGIVVTAKMK